MRHGKRNLIGILAVLALGTDAPAATPDSQGNPYETIVGRNVFGLKSPPPPPDPTANVKVEPPKIRLQGLTTILGRKQVMLKVMAKPPTQPKDESYIIDEHQRQGEIEVLAIDEVKGTVDFKISGSPVTLNMKDNADTPPAGASPFPGLPPPGGVAGVPGLPPAPSASGANPSFSGGVTTFGSKSPPARPLRGGAETIGGAPAGAINTAQPAPTAQALPTLSREEQEIIIEARRLHYQDTGDSRAKILPRTSVPKD